MASAMFYHLNRGPAEATLPMLLTKSLEAGWRVLVRGRDAGLIARLDLRLWTEPADGFLPHGVAGGPHDADQPVLLTTSDAPAPDAPNAPDCLIALDRAPVDVAEAQALARTCILFDAADPEAMELARAQWRALSAAGIPAQYWSDASGGWRKERG
jgi:DNA polymerase-3 subunit chi